MKNNLANTIIVDIIFLSYAKTENLKQLTEQSIKTLLTSEDPTKIQFNILVIESNKALEPFQFENTLTIYPNEEFGFNKYLNIGIRETVNKYICFCNNDLIFHKNWATNILIAKKKQDFACASTYWKKYHLYEKNIEPNSGNIPGGRSIFSGWCFLISRSLIDKIGLFDEKINFWYSDDDFCKVLEKNNLTNILVTNANVTHVGGYSLNTLNKKQKLKYTILPQLYYEYKWGYRSSANYIFRYVWNFLKINLVR